MLSTDADAVFWMSRYLERTGNIARFLDVNWHMTLDVPGQYGEQWKPLVITTGDKNFFETRYADENKENVIYFLTADDNNPNSILSCLRMARHNAMCIRDIIPTEMWEAINVFYHYVQDACRDPKLILKQPDTFCAEVKWRNLTIGGIASDIMGHDEAWRFFRMGRLLERADKTSRILDVKYFMLLPTINHVGTTLDTVQWTALLKAIGGFQAFRHTHGRILPEKVAEFMILDHEFPRSVLYCLTEAQHCLHDITGTRIGYFTNPAELQLGQICAGLSYHTIDEIFEQGLHEFIDDLQMRLNVLGKAIFETFFSRLPAIETNQQQ
ncbi:alpha-E domain-containing protein [Desulfonatronovibrio magnus]|uniref:alpha-E domain-containing protein n=1 Tax=Desulfonatronovibrio magnus TaxID=698827 RepID=UPI0005EBEF00|nr:alpha-E domain-containing protein [Desulfonatronovibrio magnus]